MSSGLAAHESLGRYADSADSADSDDEVNLGASVCSSAELRRAFAGAGPSAGWVADEHDGDDDGDTVLTGSVSRSQAWSDSSAPGGRRLYPRCLRAAPHL
eukprot:SAG31_NODE_6808_length_1880_cov_2.376193_2_plen_100_part_00